MKWIKTKKTTYRFSYSYKGSMVNFEAIHWNISSCMKLIFLKCMCRLNSVQNISSNIMDILFLQKATTLFSVLRRWTRKKFVKWKLSWILLAVGSTSTIYLLCYLFTNLENVELGYDEGGVYELRLLRGCSWAEVDKSFLLLLLLLHLKHAFNRDRPTQF